MILDTHYFRHNNISAFFVESQGRVNREKRNRKETTEIEGGSSCSVSIEEST